MLTDEQVKICRGMFSFFKGDLTEAEYVEKGKLYGISEADMRKAVKSSSCAHESSVEYNGSVPIYPRHGYSNGFAQVTHVSEREWD